MKNLLLLLSMSIIVSCTEKKPKTSSNDKNEAVCIWDGAALRQGPNNSSKWLSPVSLGEKVTLLGETQIDSAENIEYYQVKLSDGKEGWMSSSLIIPGGKVAATIEKTYIYLRPDLLNATNKTLNIMEMVVILSESGDWVEVTGNQKKKTGWIKASSLTDSSLDVSVAILYTKAMGENDHGKRMEQLNKIIENSDLQGSYFISFVKKKIDPFIVKKVVQVSTGLELANAIASNTKIEIVVDEINLSSIGDTSIGMYNGYELYIEDIKNLIIEGINTDYSKLSSDNEFSDIISLNNVDNVCIKNLSLGHNVEPGGCEESAVIRASESKNIYIDNCDLYGSGDIGLQLYDISGLKMENSVIRECNVSVINADQSGKLSFIENIFRNNKGYNEFVFSMTNNTQIKSCEIYDNKTEADVNYGFSETALFYLDDYSVVDVSGCLIINNNFAYYILGNGQLNGSENEIGSNSWNLDEYEGEGEDYEPEGGY